MRETFSNDFKRFLLMRFTEELIRNSEKRELTKLQEIVELKEKSVKPTFLIVPKKMEIKKVPIKPVRQPVRQKIRAREIPRHSLFIPESTLPEHLAYLKPIPSAGIEIDLFKLNPLIKDPAIRIIEVNPDEKVIVTGRTIGTRLTDIVLNEEDINRVINKISEASKIPATEGIYKIVIGNMVVLAIISEIVGSRFIIKKMIYPVNRHQYP